MRTYEPNIERSIRQFVPMLQCSNVPSHVSRVLARYTSVFALSRRGIEVLSFGRGVNVGHD